MCFSATASFSAAGILTIAGIATLHLANRQKLSPGNKFLASFPLIFGLQQAAEGFVWLGINDVLHPTYWTLATSIFIFTAYGFWPVAGPVVGFMLERSRWRRAAFLLAIMAGLTIAIYLNYAAFLHPHTPMAEADWGGHIWYVHEFVYVPHMEKVYFLTACSVLLLSTNRTAFWFAVALTVGFFFTYFNYRLEVLASVWCFFAAAASMVIVAGFHLQKSKQRLLAS